MAMTFTVLTGAKTVTGSIKSWQNYAKVDAEGVLVDAEAMIFTRLRVQQMRASESLSAGVGKSNIDLPDGFIDPIRLRDITNDCDITLKDEGQLEGIRSWTAGVLDSGDPAYYAIFDEVINFDCKVTTAFSARMLFYRQPDALSTSNETNWLTRRYPHVLRMACLAAAARFSHDDELFNREQRLCFAEIDEINKMDELSRRGQDNPVLD